MASRYRWVFMMVSCVLLEVSCHENVRIIHSADLLDSDWQYMLKGIDSECLVRIILQTGYDDRHIGINSASGEVLFDEIVSTSRTSGMAGSICVDLNTQQKYLLLFDYKTDEHIRVPIENSYRRILINYSNEDNVWELVYTNSISLYE